MNEVINIQIAGQVFYIDRKAFEELELYFAKLKKSIGNSDDIEEIIGDIEVRVAELLIGRKRKKKEHITVDDILFVVETIGPISEDEEEVEIGDNNTQDKPTKRLYRDLSKGMISGVCSGLGTYFNIPIGLVRLIFILLLFAVGTSLLIYLIAWVTIPPILQLSNKSDESKKIPIPWYQIVFFLPFFIAGKIIKFFQRLYNGETKQLTIILKFILSSFLIGFNIGMIALLFAFNQYKWMNIIYQLIYTLSFICTLIVLDIYFLGKIYRDLNYFQRMNTYVIKNVKLFLIVSAGLIVSLIVYFNIKIDVRDSFVTRIEYPVKSKKITVQYELNEYSKFRPYIRFEASPNKKDSLLHIELYYSAFGEDSFSAQENAEQIDYKYSFNDSVLTLPDNFDLIQGGLYRQQRMVVRIIVPHGIIIETDGGPLPTITNSYDRREDYGNFDYSVENTIFYWTRNTDTRYVSYAGELYSLNRLYKNRLSKVELLDFTRKSMRILFESNRNDYYTLRNWIQTNNRQLQQFAIPLHIAEQILEIMMSHTKRAFFDDEESISLDIVSDLLVSCQNLEEADLNMERYIEYLKSLLERKEAIAVLFNKYAERLN